MENWIAEYGLVALAFFLFIDDLGFPFPTTTILFSSAIFAHTNPEIDFLPLVLIALFLPPISNGILFFAGQRGLRNWLHQHGHRFFLTSTRLIRAEKFFEKYGEKTVFFGSMWTTIRPLCSVIAGSLGMKFAKFAIFHFAGVVIWVAAVLGTGFFWGREIWEILREFWWILAVGILVGLVWRLIFRIFSGRK